MWYFELIALEFDSKIVILIVYNIVYSKFLGFYSYKNTISEASLIKTIQQLDRTDRKILEVLQKNARIANVALARRVNLTPTPCLERVKRLEKDGFITDYVALLDPIKANAALCAYLEIQLSETTTEALQRFNQHMLALDEVMECQLVAGGFDYIIKIRVADMQHYQRFLGEKLSTIQGISQSHTYVVIEDIKSITAINLAS
tara:strand:- start:34 stop:639 length:606 start_codon:yes stop_codon:yes gene_type:complete